MTVFKTFWLVVKKYKATIILYSVMLIVFGGINLTQNQQNNSFVDSKPDIVIVNNDENGLLSKNLVSYLKSKTNLVNLEDNEEAREDALFYRNIDYIIYIPKNYTENSLNRLNPPIDIKTSNNYMSSFTEMLLTGYIETQNIYIKEFDDVDKVISSINKSLESKTKLDMVSSVNTNETSKIATYFNFASYSIMAVVIYIICLVLSSFNIDGVRKRTIISSINYKKFNKELLISSFLFSTIIWLLYVILGFILLDGSLLNLRGLVYIFNALIFTFCALTLALFISTLVRNKNAINGIVNVVALGSAFLCGAFIPAEWLPDSVLKIAHILPAYWFINSNDLLKNIDVLNFNSLSPVLINFIVLGLFSILFIILNNILTKIRRKTI